MRFLCILITLLGLRLISPAQVVFPSCGNLWVTEMGFDETTSDDKLFITVFNDCDACDSIPLAADIKLYVQDLSEEAGHQISVHDDMIYLFGMDLRINEIAIHTIDGKLVSLASRLSVTRYDLNLEKPGLYILSVGLSDNRKANLKYYKSR